MKVLVFSRHECLKLKRVVLWHKPQALPSSALYFWKLIISVTQRPPKSVQRTSLAQLRVESCHEDQFPDAEGSGSEGEVSHLGKSELQTNFRNWW